MALPSSDVELEDSFDSTEAVAILYNKRNTVSMYRISRCIDHFHLHEFVFL